MKFLYGIIIAFSMYSKIPMPKIEWSKERMEYVMCFFPLVGVVLAVLTWASGILWFSLRPGDLLRLGWVRDALASASVAIGVVLIDCGVSRDRHLGR